MKKCSDKFYDAHFDCHMHLGIGLSFIFNDKFPFCQNLQGIIEKLSDSFVNTAIVFPFPDDFLGNEVVSDPVSNKVIRGVFESVPYQIANKRLLDEVELTGQENILPFLMFSLRYGVKEQLTFLEQCVKDHFVYGMKYYADADGIPLKNFPCKAEPFIEFMLKHDLPIVFHVSGNTVVNDGGVSFPNDIIDLALAYPELRISIAHCAHFSKSFFSALSNACARNIYIDVSPFLHLCNVRLVSHSEKCLDLHYDEPISALKDIITRCPERMMWGSDYPFNYTCNLNSKNQDKTYTPYSYRAHIELLSLLDDKQRELITRINPLKFIFG